MTTHIHIYTRSKDSSSVEDAPFNYSEYLKWGRSQKIDEGKLKAEYEKWLSNQKKRFPDQSAEQQETMAAKVAKSSFETRRTGDAPSEEIKTSRATRLARRFGIPIAVARKELEAEEWNEEEAATNLRAIGRKAKDAKFTGPESAWKTKVLNTHPGTFFRPHPTDPKLVRATKDGKSVGSYNTEKREGEIESVEVKDATSPEQYRARLKTLENGRPSQWEKAKEIQREIAKLMDKTADPVAKKGLMPLLIEAGNIAFRMKKKFELDMKNTANGMVTHRGNPVYLD